MLKGATWPGGRQLARLTFGVVLLSLFGWLPATAAVRADRTGGERLAFLRGTIATTPCGVVYTMKADGADQRRFPGVRPPVCFPAWSRSGKKVAFVFVSGRPAGIYTLNADGSGLRRLTTGRTDFESTWSPDGGRLAFTRNLNLYVVNADGSGFTPLTHITAGQGVDLRAPRWSPDGRRIAFQAEGSKSAVYVFAFGTRKATALGAGGSPGWSPDGKQIVFEHNGRLELRSADGGKAHPLVPGYGPAWSPDGRKIAFWRRTTGAQSSIYVVNADGSGEHRVSKGPYDTTPAWLPG